MAGFIPQPGTNNCVEQGPTQLGFFYGPNNGVIYCMTGCWSCTGPSTCSVCFTLGYYLDPVSSACVACSPTCRSCSGPTAA